MIEKYFTFWIMRPLQEWRGWLLTQHMWHVTRGSVVQDKEELQSVVKKDT